MMNYVNPTESSHASGNGAAAAQQEAAVELLEQVRAELAGLELPLELPTAEEARQKAANALGQLNDYILPRWRSLDAPLLAVVGGSTGAGKSTLVNALAGHPVTRSGAIRPTTRQPILLHHPLDADWFTSNRVLPTLSRVQGEQVRDNTPSSRAGVNPDAGAMTSLVLVADQAVPRGVAILDAPDVDSISDDNRQLAGQLLAAADLWLFVTTANRYADAVPWKLLLDAASRDITVAVILDRVPARVLEQPAHPSCGSAAQPASDLWLVPIPSTGSGWRRRGYDPVALLLRALVAEGRLPPGMVVAPILGIKVKAPWRRHNQKALGRAARRSNVRNTMKIRRFHGRGIRLLANPNGQPVLLLDDVLTTGSTLQEAAKTLETAGFLLRGAVVLAAARAPDGDDGREG